MQIKLVQSVVGSLLVAALLLSPLPLHHHSSVSAASVSTTAAAAAKTSAIQVVVDGKKLSLSAEAFADKGVTFVPMRDIFKALGVSLTWEGNSQTIIGRKDNITISLKVGKKEAVVNSKIVKMDAAAIVRNGVTFVPVRFITESFKATLKWDAANLAIRIITPEAAAQAEYDKWLKEQANLPKLTPKQIVDANDQSIVFIMTNIGQGSGVVVGEHLILTNFHVMKDAASATALTLHGKELEIAGVVNVNKNADLAIIKTVDPIKLPAVKVGYGFNVSKGDKVIAIGSPLGFQNTISEGLVSNISFEGGARYIQMSAPIDHGSSGGALFSEYGELIGITTSGIPNTSANLNFAVSVMHAAILIGAVDKEQLDQAAFLPNSLPETLIDAPLSDIQALMVKEFGTVQTTEGRATFSNWTVERDSEGWLVLKADIDPRFYMAYGSAVAQELRIWSINLGYDLNRMLPGEQIQVLISYERDFGFKPRDLAPNEVTSIGGGKWRVRYPVIDMQLKNQLYIKVRT